MKNKNKYRYKITKREADKKPTVPKTSVSVRMRVILLLVWGIIAIGIYAALSQVSIFYSLWVFVFLLSVSFVAYFIIGIRVARYMREDKGNSDSCRKLVDIGKMLLIFMLPSVLIIIYDFIATTYKMFM